ncbi:CDP-alcohol phosphatidyltransferase family protein [Sphingobium herbicidovorans]|nr:CDP-alcohol phosphatidyltransferase family protein [Sphingobium herbicidovorans]
MTNAERVQRMANEAAGKGRHIAPGNSLAVNLQYVFDPILLREVLRKPNCAFVLNGELLIGQIDPDIVDIHPRQQDGLEIIELGGGYRIYNEQLRKLETPYAERLTPQTRRSIERRSYYGAYKGVTDLLTKYLWPELALWLTRGAAQVGMTPNMITAIGAILCITATFLFSQGHYWTGMLAGFGFMVLDTVDGKLARCTITSSKWGNIFDHGIDLIHPPFWWYAWGLGLRTWDRELSPSVFWVIMGVIFAGYVLQRLIEGVFMRAFDGMHIHVWQRFDTWFRLITARRNPNMVILFVALIAGRPDIGLIALAWWTAISLIVHAVRLLQAYGERRAGRAIVSWMEANA